MELKYNFQTFRGDIFGGITTAVVGLPVALAFGVASGLGAIAGIYGAIAVGFFAAVFGGTRGQISGPTGPMSVAMAVIVTIHASSLAEAFTIVIMAGSIQVLLGVLRIGRFVAYTPYSVISGFMSGIGIIIIILQVLPFIGEPAASGGPRGAINAWLNVTSHLDHVNLSALAISVATLAAISLWPNRLSRFFPSTLVALLVGTLMGVFWLTGTPVIGEVPTGLPTLQMPVLSLDFLLGSFEPALTLALLGSIDSLLTSLISDSMTRSQHNANRELIGQGIGNMAAGLVGGIPGAGTTPSSVVNIRAGGLTRLSGALWALILLTMVLGLGKYVEAIPHAVLAGILMKVGWDIIDWRFLAHLRRVQPEHLLVMLMTLGLTVFVDLITAVVVGLIAAGMASARQFERMELDNVVSVPLLDSTFLYDDDNSDDTADPFAARVGLVSLRGSFSVASSNKLVTAIGADIKEHEVVILDFSQTVYIDDSAALVVEQMIDAAIEQNTDCIVVGIGGPTVSSLHALDVLRRVPRNQFAGTLDEARDIAKRILPS